jgi:hypothetical protein
VKEEIKMLRVEIMEEKTIEKLEKAVNRVLIYRGDSVQTVEYAAVKKDLNVYYSVMIVYKD